MKGGIILLLILFTCVAACDCLMLPSTIFLIHAFKYITYFSTKGGNYVFDPLIITTKTDLKRNSFCLLFLAHLNQIKPNLAGMVPGWVPFKIVSDSPALHSRWLLLLKIEISSIVHCCFSISQNELKF